MSVSLVGIKSVDWGSLSHAYGEAVDTPKLLKRLLDKGRWEDALSDLFASILHQGTIYTATIPVVPLIAQVAANADAPGRQGALWFLAGYADSIQAGQSLNSHYLPEGTDMEVFDREARAALSAAVKTVASGISDADHEIRAVTALLMSRLETMPDDIAARLRRQLDDETDSKVASTIIITLLAAGVISPRDAQHITKDKSKLTQFTVAWMALESGDGTDEQTRGTVVQLWDECADDFAQASQRQDLISELAEQGGSSILPLLNDLAGQPSAACLETALHGYMAVARTSRSDFTAAVAGLRMIAQLFIESDPTALATETAEESADGTMVILETVRSLSLRQRLLDGLVEVAQGVDLSDGPAESEGRQLALVIEQLVAGDPIPAWASTTSPASGRDRIWFDMRAKAAVGLYRLGASEWLNNLDVAIATLPSDPTLYLESGHSRFPSVNAFIDAAQAAPGLLISNPQGLALVKHGLHLPGQRASWWLPLLEFWSDAQRKEVVAAVIEVLPRAVPQTSRLLARWMTAEAIPALSTVTNEGSPDAIWASAALGIITGDGTVIDKGIQRFGKPKYQSADFLMMWSKVPTPGLDIWCSELLDGKVQRSFPDQELQLAAARVRAAGQGDVLGAWPTVLAIIDKAQRPLKTAIVTAQELLHHVRDEATSSRCRDELTTLLMDIVITGREDWGEIVPESTVAAAQGLSWLGTGDPEVILDHLLDVLTQAAKYPGPQHYGTALCETLVLIAQSLPARIEAVKQVIKEARQADRRVATASLGSVIAVDTAWTTQLDEALRCLEAAEG